MFLGEIIQSQLINIVQFIIVVVIGVILTKFLTDALKYFFKKPEVLQVIEDLGYEQPVVEFVVLTARYFLYLLTVMIALSQFGFATIIFDIIIVLLVILIAFLVIYSLKDIIPNAIAGIYLQIAKPFEPGETITVGVYHGKIVEITLMTTILKDKTSRIIVIPNANLTRKEIIKEKPLKKSKKK